MSQSVSMRFLRLAHGEGLEAPAYQSAEAAGLDLICAIAASEPVLLSPGQRRLIPTGFAIELPVGYEGQVRPRSGLAAKYGVTVLNSPGTIDSDYRGEVKVILFNAGDEPFVLERGMRIAQLVVAPVSRVEVQMRETLSDTKRGEGGFGSTGTKPAPGS